MLSRYEHRGGALLLGNGSSISIDKNFSYEILYKNAKEKLSIDELDKVFDQFGTNDFEVVLGKLSEALVLLKLLRDRLGLNVSGLQELHDKCKQALIESVIANHPKNYPELAEKLKPMAKVARSFDTVITTNYDLLLYWALYQAMEFDGYPKKCFVDFFWKKKELDNSVQFNKFEQYSINATKYYYLHGNLCLAKIIRADTSKDEGKLLGVGADLDEILKSWNQESVTPHFIAEGSWENKVAAINGSDYLRHVYHEVLGQYIQGNLTVYGFGFNPNDEHIIKKININNRIDTLYVSIYQKSLNSAEEMMNRISSYFPNKNIEYFDAKTFYAS